MRLLEDENHVAHGDLQCEKMVEPSRVLHIAKAYKFDNVSICECVHEVDQ